MQLAYRRADPAKMPKSPISGDEFRKHGSYIALCALASYDDAPLRIRDDQTAMFCVADLMVRSSGCNRLDALHALVKAGEWGTDLSHALLALEQLLNLPSGGNFSSTNISNDFRFMAARALALHHINTNDLENVLALLADENRDVRKGAVFAVKFAVAKKPELIRLMPRIAGIINPKILESLAEEAVNNFFGEHTIWKITPENTVFIALLSRLYQPIPTVAQWLFEGMTCPWHNSRGYFDIHVQNPETRAEALELIEKITASKQMALLAEGCQEVFTLLTKQFDELRTRISNFGVQK